MEPKERACGRIALSTPGGGNCWFNAVASELLRLRLLGEGRRQRAAKHGRSLRAQVAAEATPHVGAMRRCGWARAAREKLHCHTLRLVETQGAILSNSRAARMRQNPEICAYNIEQFSHAYIRGKSQSPREGTPFKGDPL